MDNPTSINVNAALEKTRLKLLDLSRRNRLLNYRRNKLSIIIVDEQPRLVFERLVADGKKMVFDPLLEPDYEIDELAGLRSKEDLIEKLAESERINISEELPDLDINYESKHSDSYLQTKLFMPELETRLRRISSSARAVIEETGQNQLYLAIGFLYWREHAPSDQAHEAPLILLPVELERRRIDLRTKCYRYAVNYTGEDLLPNLSLAEMLKQEFGVLLPSFDDILDTANGEGSLDPELYFDEVKAAVTEMNGWQIKRKMVLGFFTFSKSLMYLDLDPARWPKKNNIVDHKLIKNIIVGCEKEPSGLERFEDLDEDSIVENVPLVVDADSSQLRSILNSLKGRSIVIEGPPGTGKSQTITNLIACFANQGKSVLFVAEKMAALDVVKRNLSNIGLGEFCLELHSHKARKQRVIDDLANRINSNFSEPKQISNEVNKLKQIRRELGNYVNLVNKPVGPFNESIFDILWKADRYFTELSIKRSFSIKSIEKATANGIEERLEILRTLASLIKSSKTPTENIWYGYYPTKLYFGDLENIEENLQDVIRAVDHLVTSMREMYSSWGLSFDADGVSLRQLESIYNLKTIMFHDYVLLEIAPRLFKNLKDVEQTKNRLNELIGEYDLSIKASSAVFIDPEIISNRTLDNITDLETRLSNNAMSSLSVKTIELLIDYCIDLVEQLIKLKSFRKLPCQVDNSKVEVSAV